MKCMVCGSSMSGEECPVCGYEVDYISGTLTEEAQKEALESAKEYKEYKLGKSNLAIVTYSYKEQNEKIVLDKESDITFAGWRDLNPGEIKWHNEKFARVERDFDLTLKVTSVVGRTAKRALKMKCPATTEFWQVGIKMLEGLAVSVVVGTPSGYSESTAIKLI